MEKNTPEIINKSRNNTRVYLKNEGKIYGMHVELFIDGRNAREYNKDPYHCDTGDYAANPDYYINLPSGNHIFYIECKERHPNRRSVFKPPLKSNEVLFDKLSYQRNVTIKYRIKERLFRCTCIINSVE